MSFSHFSGVVWAGDGGGEVSVKCWNKASVRSFKIFEGHVVVVDVCVSTLPVILIFKRCMTWRIVALRYFFQFFFSNLRKLLL